VEDKMSEQERIAVAKQYVDEQIKTMKENGGKTEIPSEQYDRMVAKVAKTILCK
jgi:hypothetical protein